VVGIAGQVPAGPLAVQAAIVDRAADAVGDVLAALIALDLPADRRGDRIGGGIGHRHRDQAAALLLGVVDAAVLVVRVIADHDRELVRSGRLQGRGDRERGRAGGERRADAGGEDVLALGFLQLQLFIDQRMQDLGTDALSKLRRVGDV